MPRSCLILLFCLPLAGGEPSGPPMIEGKVVPPSPADPVAHPGLRIWDEPAFTHWPSIVYDREERNLAFFLPVPANRELDQKKGFKRPEGGYSNPFGWQAGDQGTIGWEPGAKLPFTLDADPEIDRVSGLLTLPLQTGIHTAVVTIAKGTRNLRLRIADAKQTWPLAKLVNGFPVDAEGVPTVLVDQRPDPGRERRFEVFKPDLPRPTGRALVVGDPMAAMGSDCFRDLDAEVRPATDLRYPQNAALIALASLGAPLPRTILWSPGNDILFANAWSEEEDRLLGGLRTRLESLGAMPRLVLLLPPLPVDDELQERAVARREFLQRSAQFRGWSVLDVQMIIKDQLKATEVGPSVHTRYPHGLAMVQIRQAIAQSLAQ